MKAQATAIEEKKRLDLWVEKVAALAEEIFGADILPCIDIRLDRDSQFFLDHKGEVSQVYNHPTFSVSLELRMIDRKESLINKQA